MQVYVCVCARLYVETPAALALVGWRLAVGVTPRYATPFLTLNTTVRFQLFINFYFIFIFYFLNFIFCVATSFHVFVFVRFSVSHSFPRFFVSFFSCFLPCAHSFGPYVGGYVVVIIAAPCTLVCSCSNKYTGGKNNNSA